MLYFPNLLTDFD